MCSSSPASNRSPLRPLANKRRYIVPSSPCQQTLTRATKRSQVKTNLLDRRAANYRVSTHQNTGIVLVVWNDLTTGVDLSDDTFMVRRQPRRRLAFPLRNVWTTNEVYVARREGLINRLIPRLVNLFVVVNKTDQITLAASDAGVERRRSALHRFKQITKPAVEASLPILHHRARVVFGVVIDDRNADTQSFGNRRRVQTLQTNRQQISTIVSWDDNFESHR